MSLPVRATHTLTGAEIPLSVLLTIRFGVEFEEKEYPGCYAVRNNMSEVLVFAYSDGPGAIPRARWRAADNNAGIHVVGVEHFGDHHAQPQWHDAHGQSRRAPVQPPQPAPGPDYPVAVPAPVLPPVVVPSAQVWVSPPSHAQVDAETDASVAKLSEPLELGATQSFPPIEGEEPPGGSQEASDSDRNGDGTSGHATNADLKEIETWKPRGVPTPHRVLPDESPKQKSSRKPRGTARALKGVGMALLLGFAMLGFNPNV